MADKKKLGDYIEVSLPNMGSTAVIRRGDGEDDEAWAAVKKRIEMAGLQPVVKKGDPKPQSGKTTIDMTEIQDSPDFETTLRAASPQGVAMEKARAAAPQRTVDVGEPYAVDTAPEEAQPLPEMKSYVAQPGSAENPIQVPADKIKASPTAGPFDHLKNPLSSEPEAAPDTGGPMPASPGALQPQPPPAAQTNPVLGVGEQVARNFGAGPLIDTYRQAVGPNRGPTDALREVGAAAGSSPGSQMAQLQEQSATTQPPAAPPTPGAPPSALKTELSTSIRAPGAGRGNDLEAASNRTFADAIKANSERIKLEAEQSKEAAALELERAQQLQNIEEIRSAKANALLAEQDRIIKAQRDISAKLDESLKIDPRRLWNNRTAEQKANAQLAGFLFGLGGNGLQYVQMLQSEVDRDVQNQVQEFQSRRSGLEKQLEVQQNLFAQYRQMGMDSNQASAAAKENMLGIYQARLNALTETYKGKTAGARAAEAAAAIGVQRIELNNKLRDSASERASRAYTNYLQAKSMEMKANEKKPREIPQTIAEKLANDRKMLTTIRRMKALAANEGVLDRAGQKAGAMGFSSEQQGKSNAYDTQKMELARYIAASSLQKPEQDYLLPKLGERGQLIGDPVKTLDEIERSARESLRSHYETLRLSGFDFPDDPLAQEQVNFKPE